MANRLTAADRQVGGADVATCIVVKAVINFHAILLL